MASVPAAPGPRRRPTGPAPGRRRRHSGGAWLLLLLPSRAWEAARVWATAVVLFGCPRALSSMQSLRNERNQRGRTAQSEARPSTRGLVAAVVSVDTRIKSLGSGFAQSSVSACLLRWLDRSAQKSDTGIINCNSADARTQRWQALRASRMPNGAPRRHWYKNQPRQRRRSAPMGFAIASRLPQNQ